MPRVGFEPTYPHLRLHGYWDRPSKVYYCTEVMGLVVSDRISLNPHHLLLNPLTPNDHYSGRTAPLTSKRCILYIYSNKYRYRIFYTWYILSVFPSSKCSLFHNSNVFGYCIIHILYTCVLKLKK